MVNDKNYYRMLLAAGDPFAIALTLISNVLESEKSMEEKLRHIEMIKEAGMELGIEVSNCDL